MEGILREIASDWSWRAIRKTKKVKNEMEICSAIEVYSPVIFVEFVAVNKCNLAMSSMIFYFFFFFSNKGRGGVCHVVDSRHFVLHIKPL